MRWALVFLFLFCAIALAKHSSESNSGEGKKHKNTDDSSESHEHGGHGHRVTKKPKTTTTRRIPTTTTKKVRTTTAKRVPTTTTKKTTPRRTTTTTATTTAPTTTTTTRTTSTTTTTTTTAPTTPKLECAGSVYPKTAQISDDQLTWNPNISFKTWTDPQGCDWLNVTCSGYYFVELETFSISGREFIYADGFAPDNDTAVSVSVQLPWAKYGWGAPTQDLQPANNAFYCMVWSLVPLGKTKTPAPVKPTAATSQPSIKPVPTVSEGPSCECNYSTVWVDLMLVFDASASTGPRGLQQMLGYAQTSLSWFNIQKSNTNQKFHTRVGIVTYGASAQVVASLGSLDGDDLSEIQELTYSGEKVGDIEKAIDLAVKQFETNSYRSNARRVIALFATSYDQTDSPKITSDEFTGSNGILVVYNYVQDHGQATPELSELSSPGYFFSNLNDPQGDALKNALCNANCYCPDNYIPFKNDDVNGVPTAGCYYSVNIEGNYRVASNRCQKYNNGYLAEGKTADKTTFLQNQFELKSANFWSGLTWDMIESEYLWIDGSPLVSSSSYQPWAGTRQTGMDCVAVMNQKWVPVDCRKGFEYICETNPCDSEHYCEDKV